MRLKPGDEGFVFSYTQLTTFATCHYNYFLKYIEEGPLEEAQNAFAQYGTLIHGLIDEWAKGMLPLEDMAQAYQDRYSDVVTVPFPRYMRGITEKMYDAGLSYCKNFVGFPGYDILATEKTYFTDIGSHKFKGVVDMILRDQESGGLVILDHKSKSLSTFKKERKTIWKQQVLYSKFVHDELNEWPTTLAFNLFREGGMIIAQQFDMAEYERTIDWATKIMDEIEANDLLDMIEMKEKPDAFCNDICGMREHCAFGSMKPPRKGE